MTATSARCVAAALLLALVARVACRSLKEAQARIDPTDVRYGDMSELCEGERRRRRRATPPPHHALSAHAAASVARRARQSNGRSQPRRGQSRQNVAAQSAALRDLQRVLRQRVSRGGVSTEASKRRTTLRRATIKRALADFERTTCYRFPERTWQTDYINIVKRDGCWRYVADRRILMLTTSRFSYFGRRGVCNRWAYIAASQQSHRQYTRTRGLCARC